MILKDLLDELEKWAPKVYAEDFDNVGLLVGNPQQKCEGVLVSLDCTLKVIEEAKRKHCNIILCFHPIIFSGLKKITENTYVERIVQQAIKNDIAIVALHTRLDNHPKGVNYVLEKALGIQNSRVLIPKAGGLKKLSAYVPKDFSQSVLDALCQSGAGSIGNYDECSFSITGSGQFRGKENSQPFIGKVNERITVDEVQIQMVFASHLQSKVIHALHESHPYETVAFEILPLENTNPEVGMGRIGELSNSLECIDFLSMLKKALGTKVLRHSAFVNKKIHKVAVLGGSGSFAIDVAKQQGADAFVTADLKYHHFFQGEESLLLVDVGHYESEQFVKKLIFDYLNKKMYNFAIVLSETLTNPVNYF